MTLIARQQSAGGHEPVFRSHSRACAALESGGPWKASRRDETSFFATASKKPVDLAVWGTKPGQGSLDGTLSHAAWKCVPRCVEFCTHAAWNSVPGNSGSSAVHQLAKNVFTCGGMA